MRRTIDAYQFARLVTGQVIDLDGVQLCLDDIGAASIEAIARRAREARDQAELGPQEQPPACNYKHQANALVPPAFDPSRWPPGAELLTYVDRHPSDQFDAMHAIVRLHIGQVVAWNGTAFRALPVNWSDLVTIKHHRKDQGHGTHHEAN